MAVRRILAWVPNAGAQTEFINSKEFEVFIAGGRGGGKSDALIVYPLIYAKYPTFNGVILRRRLTDILEIKDRCMRLYKKIDPGCFYDRNDNRFIFSSGATCELGHCNLEEDKYKYQGREYQQLLFDEAPQFTHTQYEEIKLSCRSKDPRMPPIVRATGNPGGISHFYFRDRFMQQPPSTVITETLTMPDGTKNTLTRKWIRSTVYDNPILLKNDPQYIAVLQSIPDTRLRRMMLDGDWDAAEGMFMSTFERMVHVRPLKELLPPHGYPPGNTRIVASLDWGYATPYAIYWHAIDNMDRIITFREHYGIAIDHVRNQMLPNIGLRKTASEVCDEFIAMSADLHGRIEALIIDPSTQNTTGSVHFSIYHDFCLKLQEHGIPVIKGANRREGGWDQMRARLNLDPGTGKPWWFIAEECTHLVRTISSTPEDPNNNFEPPPKAEDHALDSCRYLMMYIPLPIEQLQRRIAEKYLADEKQDDDVFSGFRDGIESFRRRGGQGHSERMIDSYLPR